MSMGQGNSPAGWRSARPFMPAGYGLKPVSEGSLVPWEHIISRLQQARNYWISSVSPRGRAHAMPVWGLWDEGRFVFSTDPASRKASNLKARPLVVVHLESGDEVVIVEGEAMRVDDPDWLRALEEKYAAKYGYPLSGGTVFQVIPRRVFAWDEAGFPSTATKWERAEDS